MRDISERKRAEEALRESEEHFRTVFEQARFGMAMSDGQFRFFKVNQAFRDMLGYSDAELSEMTYKDADATFHEAEQIQEHLKAQDDAINTILDRLEKLEARLTKQ